jgi:Ni/Fe-hydrogenase subunit HybB-like protein
MSSYTTEGLLTEFAPQLERPSKKWYAWAGFFLLLFAFGMFGLYTQLTQGHIVTGMRDNVVWGVYIVNFIFFMGISYAGALFA